MKIRVELTIELDPEDWTCTFGVAREDVRRDVKDYVLYLVQGAGCFGSGEVPATVTLR